MLPQDINNNIIIYGASSLGGYQDEYENQELSKEKNMFLFRKKLKNCWTCGAHNSSKNQHMIKKLH